MTPADKYVAYITAAVNDPDAYKDYIWGDAGQDWDGDGGPEYDCSGLHHAALVAAGAVSVEDSGAFIRAPGPGLRRRAARMPGPSGRQRCGRV